MSKESINSYLIALHFFSRIFQKAPDKVLFEMIVEQNLFKSFEEWECFANPLKSHEIFKEINPFLCINTLSKTYQKENMKESTSSELKAICADHLNLFSGPSPICPPWESVWREKAQLLFGEQTQRVALLYNEWGVTIEKERKEPEDHLGYELSFICFLLQTMEETSNSIEIKKLAKNSLRFFLKEHVLQWVGQCLEKASASAKTTFYAESTKLCFVAIMNLFENICSE